MRRSMATLCLSGLLEDKLQAIAEAGFSSVQIAESDLLCCALPPGRIGELAARLDQPLNGRGNVSQRHPCDETSRSALHKSRTRNRNDDLVIFGPERLLNGISDVPASRNKAL